MRDMAETTARILVVDDDAGIRAALQDFLTARGYEVRAVADAVSARAALKAAPSDVVLLDVMMPGEDGLSLCRALAAKGGVRVILVSARTEEDSRILGLELGADDYVCKPFNPRELAARIEAVLRRDRPMAEASPAVYAFDRWIYDAAARSLTDRVGVVTPLSTREHQALEALVSRPSRVLSRNQLLDLIGQDAGDVFDRSIDTLISRLRRKVEQDPRRPELIVTVRGGGYSLQAKVRRL